MPWLLLRIFWRERNCPALRRRWGERLALGLPISPAEKPIWIHAVSVGETVAATPIVNYLRENSPSIPILFTTTTTTGASVAMNRFGDSVQHVFFPYDLRTVVRRYMTHFDPRLLILIETELWPNLLDECREMGVPVVLANARLSENSAARYRLIGTMAAQMLGAITCFAAQGVKDAERFIALGARADNVLTTGSIKFDTELPASVLESGQSLRRFLGANRPVLIAASTRDGEEEMLLQGFSELLHAHPNLLLLIAPRHPQRFRSVVELCERKGFAVESHQRAKICKPDIQIYVIDSMGELPNFYAASDVAFVGGSLMPNGGHNVLEPAALGVAVIVGPHTDNFSDIVQLLSTAGALLIADDVCGFVGHVAKLLADSDARYEAGAAGRRIVEENKGASVKIAQILDDILAHSGESISGTQIGLGRIKREL